MVARNNLIAMNLFKVGGAVAPLLANSQKRGFLGGVIIGGALCYAIATEHGRDATNKAIRQLIKAYKDSGKKVVKTEKIKEDEEIERPSQEPQD